VNGCHYAKTCHAWLANLFAHKAAIIALFKAHYPNNAERHFQYWHLFFRACAQCFAYQNGTEWFVIHHLCAKK